MKRIVATLLALAMLLTILPMGTLSVSAFMNDAEMDWSGLDYEINGDTVAIVGYHGTDGDVVIPGEYDGKPVVTIGVDAFANNTVIRTVALPVSVTTVKEGAFYGTKVLDVYYEGTGAQRQAITIEDNNWQLYNATWYCQGSLDELFDGALFWFDFFYPNNLLGYVNELMCGKYYDYGLADSTGDYGLQTVPAEEYEAGLARYFALTDEQLAQHRADMINDWQNNTNIPRYDEAKDAYYVQYMGGRGGMLADREYLGYEQTGDGLYTVFFQHITYDFLSDAGNKKAQAQGWPETFTYNGKVYQNGPDGYYRIMSYDNDGIMYKVEYRGQQVRILSQEDFVAADLPAYLKKATVTIQPKGAQVKNGETANVTLKATGPALTYTWYIKNKGATKYSKSSVTTNTYSVKMSSTARDRYVYCVVKDGNGNSVKSNTVVLRMAASVTKEPTTAYAKRNANATVKFTVAGDGLKYAWYVKNPGATEYVKSSVTKSTYAAKMTEANSGRLVYCIVTDKYGKSVQTKTVAMRMQASIVTQPKSVTVKNGATAKVTVKAAGEGLTYTWYIKNKSAKSFSKSSVTTNSYSVKMSTSVNGRQVYCVVKDKYGKSVKSSTVTLKKK